MTLSVHFGKKMSEYERPNFLPTEELSTRKKPKAFGDSEFDLPTLPEPLIPKNRESVTGQFTGTKYPQQIEQSFEEAKKSDISSQETDFHTLAPAPVRKISLSFWQLVSIILVSIVLGVGGAYVLQFIFSPHPK